MPPDTDPPTDAPMVLAIDRDQYDAGRLNGIWLDMRCHISELRARCHAAGLSPTNVVIIDQANLGPTMVDEDTDLPGLCAHADECTGQAVA